MAKKRQAREMEERLSREVMAKVEGKERFDPIKEAHRRVDHWQNELAKQKAQWEAQRDADKRIGRLMAKIGVVPVSIMAAGCAFIVIFGLLDGEIKEIARHGSRRISVQGDPLLFWVSIVYHSALTSLLMNAAFLCVRGSGWFTKKSSYLWWAALLGGLFLIWFVVT